MPSLTGHLVLSTIHTNDAAGAVTRLVEMEIEPFLVRSSVIGILAQRLVRILCPSCKIPYKATDYELTQMGLDALKAGAKGYVLKPFDGNKVSEAIQKACKRVVLKDKLPTDTPTSAPAEGDAKPDTPQVSG